MRLGKKVGIIDADIYGFSVPDMMGIEKPPGRKREENFAGGAIWGKSHFYGIFRGR